MGKAYDNFVKSLENPSTRYVYEKAIRQYTVWSKEHDFDKLAKRKPKALEDKIAAYINHLKEKKYAPLSIRMKVAPLKQFFVMNRVTLNWEWIMKFIPGSRIVTKDRPYTKEEIHKIIDECDPRERVMFLLMLSTGMRIGALPDLKLRDLKKLEEYGLYQIEVYAGENEVYITFTTLECAKAIDGYLESRKNRGEALKPASPLIRQEFTDERANDPKPVGRGGIKSILTRTLEDSGARVRGKDCTKRKEVMAFHGFRKYFATALNKAGAKPAIRELLLGHQSSRGLDKNYLRPADDELLEEYLKASELLTVNEENKLRLRVNDLEQKEQDIDKRIEAAVEKKVQELFGKANIPKIIGRQSS